MERRAVTMGEPPEQIVHCQSIAGYLTFKCLLFSYVGIYGVQLWCLSNHNSSGVSACSGALFDGRRSVDRAGCIDNVTYWSTRLTNETEKLCAYLKPPTQTSACRPAARQCLAA